tara:strand:+ start:803 stop:1501 length:699 start_codon:yes stop_codon:yes gene_type:complete
VPKINKYSRGKLEQIIRTRSVQGDVAAAIGGASGLQVNGALATTGSVLVSTTDGRVQGTELNINSANHLSVPGSFAITNKMTIDTEGRIGVGVLTDLTYGITLQNTSGDISVGKARAWQTYSSARYKENVCDIEDPIEKLSKLKGVYFDWRDMAGEGRDIGFIAEEVGEVLPEVVSYEEDGNDAISMSYDKIVPLLVEAFNESRERDRKNKKIFWTVTILNLALASLGAIFL